MRALLPAPFRDRPERAALATAATAWLVLAIVACAYTARKVETRPDAPLTNCTEEFASGQWWAGGDLYRPLDAPYFLYLPHAAILYTPFHAGPFLARNLVVRVVYLGLFVWALFVFAGLGDPERRALGVAVKPPGVVWLLLAGGMWPRTMAWRVAPSVVGLAAFPFVFGAPDYVAGQYADFFRKMAVESDPLRRFSDVGGMVWGVLHVEMPYVLLLAVRSVAALGALGLGLLARRRWDATGAALAFYALGAFYLVLFNPKAEGPTYALLGPALGVLLCYAALVRRSARLSLLVVGVAYGIALTYEIWGHHRYWWQPLLTIAALGVALAPLVRRRSWLPASSS